MTENILEVRNLVKDYGDFSLKQLNFDVPRGSIVGLIGENGAGKSTTINCILNEVQKNSGEILLFGKDYLQNEVENKNKIGVVFDENHFPDIFTPIEIASYMSGIYTNWNTGIYREYLKKFDLPESKAIKGFSKGMKVKLAFAVALSHKAELLILDEATSGLDPVIRDDILDILLDFVQDENHAVLVSSHIIGSVATLPVPPLTRPFQPGCGAMYLIAILVIFSVLYLPFKIEEDFAIIKIKQSK